jgi:hypothetical protein
MYSGSYLQTSCRPLVKCCLLPGQPDMKMPQMRREGTAINESTVLNK